MAIAKDQGGLFKKFVNKTVDFGASVFTSAQRRRGYGNEQSVSFIRDFYPQWVGYFNKRLYQYIYELNPVLKGIVDLKAKAQSNVKRVVMDLKTEEILPPDTDHPDGAKVYKLLTNPNPYQTGYEYNNQNKVNYNIFGDSYQYAMLAFGKNEVNLRTIQNLVNLPSQFTKVIHSGKVFDQVNIEDIITKYVVEIGTVKKEIDNVKQVLHRNDINISGFNVTTSNVLNSSTYQDGVTMGRSRLDSLMMPISNIQRAFESRNVIITQRGAMGMFSSDNRDKSIGTLPLQPEDKKDIQDELRKYGTLTEQNMFMLFNVPMKYQHLTKNMKDLMLFEEIDNATGIVSQSFGVPKLLTMNSIKGATFENQSMEMKRLYQDTIIPENADETQSLNEFFKTEDFGLRIIDSYDHIAVLQEDKKAEADRRKINSEVGLTLFLAGSIDINDWLALVGLPPDPVNGERRVASFTDREITILLKTFNVAITNPVIGGDLNGE